MLKMNQDNRLDLILEFFGALFMLAGSLYFQHFVSLQSKLLHTKPPSSQSVSIIRFGAGLIAIILVFIMLRDLKSTP